MSKPAPEERLTRLERRIIYELQGDLPASRRPFRGLAEKLGIPEEELIRKVREFEAQGKIRRFGATLRHQKSGYGGNVMVAWRVDEKRADEAGEVMSSFPEVTHCYLRPAKDHWPYTLYTMIHGKDVDACLETIDRIAAQTGVETRELLFSVKELKKTTMRYFFEEFGPEEDREP